VSGPGATLKKDPAVMASLPAEPSATDVKRAHLRSWVQSAGQAAGTTADSINTLSEDRPKDAKDLKRMARRMEDTQVFCTALNNLLMDSTRPWAATLGLIEVA
jgi:KaiC/GvpD/RAD55 family RecA-like ATPase